jgi:alcohol dehydrogenase/propanol-preferring alcohol dehydrogenase
MMELPTPEPEGTEVLLEVTHCGVCHSDIHFWEGEYNLGGGKLMKLAERGVTLPRAPGHEIVGRVVALGPDAQSAKVGDHRIAFPWLGCGKCERCAAEQDNLCTALRPLGVFRHGGFATHVIVPHSRYLIDFSGIDPAVAATYACSGLTSYVAVSKVLPLPPDRPVVLIGAGGLGLTAIAMLRALGHRAIISVDVNAEKLVAARAEGASFAIDGSGEDVAKRILAAVGGPVAAVIDFVNKTSTAKVAIEILMKGGVYIFVGVNGGILELSLVGMIFRLLRLEGVNTGTVKDLREVLALAQSGKLRPIPIQRMDHDDANLALQRLREGDVTGRVVLEHHHV